MGDDDTVNSNTLSEEELEELIAELPNILRELEELDESKKNGYFNQT